MPIESSLLLQARLLTSELSPLVLRALSLTTRIDLGGPTAHRRGYGDEFWQFRPYQTGDDATAIDWRQSARSDTVFIKDREAASKRRLWIWLDHSGSMRWRSNQALETKYERGALLLVALACLATKSGDEALWSDGNHTAISSACDIAARVAEHNGKPTDETAIPRPDLFTDHDVKDLVVIGDFLMPTPLLFTGLQSLARRGIRGYMIRLFDPAEQDFPYRGRLHLRGLENEGELEIGDGHAVQARYRSQMASHVAALAMTARALGWGFVDHRTDQSPLLPLAAYAQWLRQ